MNVLGIVVDGGPTVLSGRKTTECYFDPRWSSRGAIEISITTAAGSGINTNPIAHQSKGIGSGVGIILIKGSTAIDTLPDINVGGI